VVHGSCVSTIGPGFAAILNVSSYMYSCQLAA